MVFSVFPETFGENFIKAGCMYRGPPPEGKLYQLTPDFQASLLEAEKYSVRFSSFEWTPSDAMAEKVRQKCADLIAGILVDENSDLTLALKLSRKNLSDVSCVCWSKTV